MGAKFSTWCLKSEAPSWYACKSVFICVLPPSVQSSSSTQPPLPSSINIYINIITCVASININITIITCVASISFREFRFLSSIVLAASLSPRALLPRKISRICGNCKRQDKSLQQVVFTKNSNSFQFQFTVSLTIFLQIFQFSSSPKWSWQAIVEEWQCQLSGQSWEGWGT